MNREKKTLLNIQLLLQYYKNDNILDRYHRIIENGIIFDNEILNEIQPNIYVVKYNKYIKLKKEIDRLNKLLDETRLSELHKEYIINELENTIENFMENHTEGYIDWKYDREIYLAESNVLQKLYDTYFEKLQELKENK